jgi:hypothetical protein
VGGRPRTFAPNERADELHREAKALLEDENWEEALPKLREAYSIKPSYDIVTNLGWTLSAMEQHVEAAHRMCEALDKLPTDVDRKRFDNVYHDARSRIGIARILSAEAEVAILVDDRPASVCTHDQARIVFVEPGQHAFVAERDGRRSEPVAPTFTAGKEQLVRLGPLQEGAVAPPNGDDGGGGALVGVGWAAVGVGVAAGVVGGVLLGLSAKLDGEAGDLRNEIMARSGSEPCPGGDASCGELRDTVGSKSSYHNAGLPLAVAGGVLAVAGVVTLLVASNSDEETAPGAALLIFPVAGDGVAGVGIVGQF